MRSTRTQQGRQTPDTRIRATKGALPTSGIVALQWVTNGKVEFSRKLRRDMTPAERILWDRVRGRQWRGLKFRRQQIMHGFVADFFCEDARLVIEVDGGIHNSVEQKELDVHRQELFRLHGVRTIRLRNEEIETDIEAALSKVEAALPDAIPGSPSPPTPGALP